MKYYTVAENVMLPLRFRGVSAKESRIKAESLLDALGIKEVNRKGKTILLVTHDMQIASHANRVIYMRDGRIQ